MTSPREQAIEEIAGPGSTNLIRAIIDRYEAARARIDGAKMMPREDPDLAMYDRALGAALKQADTPFEMFCPQCRETVHSEAEARAHGLLPRAMHDATPKEKD